MFVGLPEAAGATEVFGSKAANLGRLAQAGFNVPFGYALAASLELDDETFQKELIRVLARAFEPGPVAVRSSALSEDLANASYAGVYESFLNVQDVETAVRACWASAHSPRVEAYEQAMGIKNGKHGMGVIIQEMVDADYAGVAFTMNPLTGNKQETLVSVVKGTGESLVSGKETPWECIIEHPTALITYTEEKPLPEFDLWHIDDKAREIEDLFGCPQDIEWALADNKLWILQARPIAIRRR